MIRIATYLLTRHPDAILVSESDSRADLHSLSTKAAPLNPDVLEEINTALMIENEARIIAG